MKKIKFLILLSITISIFSACGISLETKIIGRWYGSKIWYPNSAHSYIESYEFFSDNTFVEYHDNKTSSCGHGTWSLDGDSLKINDYGAGVTVFKAEYKNGDLYLDGEKFTKEYKKGNEELLADLDNKKDIQISTVPISAGWLHSLVIDNNKNLNSCGSNTYSAIGQKNYENNSRVTILEDVSSVTAGKYFSMAIKKDASLWAWGANADGVIGNNTTNTVFEPEQIMSNVIAVSISDSYSMAIRNDNSLWLWGNNQRGLFNEQNSGILKKPTKIMDDITGIATGNSHVMAIKKDNTLWTWGFNANGQLGNGNKDINTSPTEIMKNVKSIAAGDNHSMAIKQDGSLWVWGSNSSGQLGNGTTDDVIQPQKIMDGVKHISAGSYFSLVIKEDDSLWAWGNNIFGECGNGSNEKNVTTPQKIMDNVNFASAGVNFALAVTNSGELWAWGDNRSGQYGTGDNISSNIPIKVLENVLCKQY